MEFLEERGSPSVLPFHVLSDPPPERPALAPGEVRDAGLWELPAVTADAGAEDAPLLPSHGPGLTESTGFPVGELLQTILQGGSSLTGERVPGIVDFRAQEGEDGLWTFSGRVEADSPGGLLVFFGGLPTLRSRRRK